MSPYVMAPASTPLHRPAGRTTSTAPPDGRPLDVPGRGWTVRPAAARMGAMDIADADALARLAHEGQTDRIGVPYVEHVRAVAAGLVAFGPELRMAGLLHDVIEDTRWTAGGLCAAGVPDRVVAIVEQVTNQPGAAYEDTLRRIAGCRDAALAKIADNAHNSRSDRAARLDEGQRLRLAAKYRRARAILWPAVPRRDVATILTAVNPALLRDLPPAGGSR